MGLVELEDAPRLPEPGRELGTGQRFTRRGGKSLGHHTGAQNCDLGVLTGGLSPSILSAVGCEYVLVGHSERRRFASISNEKVLRKVVRAGLRCVSGKPNAVFASRAPGFPF
jgi:hypothetical protein